MKFIIRDDDLNYFSTSADIEAWYADVFAQGIPVGFATIPFIVPSGDGYPESIPRIDGEYPVDENKELVAYIKGNSLIEILQHGTTHATQHGLYEYRNPRISRKETMRGRAEIIRAFGVEPRVFVPPHDWIGNNGILSVEAANMDIIRGRGAGLRTWIPRWAYLRIFFIMLMHKLRYAFRHTVPAYPYVLDFGKHKEACSYRLEDDDVFDGLDYAHRKNGIFVVVSHLHFFTKEKKERLSRLIAKAREYGAEFVYPSELFIDVVPQGDSIRSLKA